MSKLNSSISETLINIAGQYIRSMSSPVGIGDAVLIINTAVTLWKDVRDAPAELEGAAGDVEQMKVIVEELKAQIGDETSFISRRKDIAGVIQRMLKPLLADLKQVEGMLRDFTNKVMIMGRLKYAVIDKNKLKELRAGFVIHRGTISSMLDMIHGTVAKEQIVKLDQISLQQREERDARRENDRKTEEILQITRRIENNLLSKTTKEPLDTAEVLRRVEEELVAKGTSRDKVRKQLQPMTAALLQESGTRTERLAAVWTSKPATSISNPFPTPVQSPPTLVGHRELPNMEDIRILCVDDSNGVLSILAQTYLEILRAWIAHRTGRWLFKRVDSAGVNILPKGVPSLLSCNARCGTPIPANYISGIRPEHYVWSTDYPNEVGTILERMRKHTVKPVQYEDWGVYGLILCFDTRVHNKLLEKQISALETNNFAGSTRIVRLAGCTGFSEEHLATVDKTEAMVTAVKTAIRTAIGTELGYPIDRIVDDKGFRTLQFVLPESKIAQFAHAEPTLVLNEAPKMKELERKYSCSIRVTKITRDRGGTNEECLVSIIGPKGSNLPGEQIRCLLSRVETEIRGRSSRADDEIQQLQRHIAESRKLGVVSG